MLWTDSTNIYSWSFRMIREININPPIMIKMAPWKQCYEQIPQISTKSHFAWLVWLILFHLLKGAPENNHLNRFHKYLQLVISQD